MTKTVLITGGARGIGAACALGAARQGYRVALGYESRKDRADAVVAAIAREGGEAIALAGNVAEEASVVALFAAVDRAFGPLGALVNCAGIVGPPGRIEDCAASDLANLFAVNVTGTLLCCREAIGRLSTKHGGSGGAIVNLSSAASRLGGAGEFVAYGASKGAIDSLTFGLAQEVAAEGIRVNAVRPGVIDTEIHPPGRLERVGPLLPMKRTGKPEEVADAILWLLSDQAAYVSGTVLDVSGGR